VTTANSIEPYDTMLGQIPFTPTLDVDWYRLLLLPSEIGLPFEAALKETHPSFTHGLGLGLFDADGGLIDFSGSSWPEYVYWTSSDITQYLQVTVTRYLSPPVAEDYELKVFPAAPTSTPYPHEAPFLNISFREGAPGSMFSIMGANFPETEQASIYVNTRFVGAVPCAYGGFRLVLDTTGADEGLYVVVAATPTALAAQFFIVDANQRVRDPVGDGPIFPVPAGSAFSERWLLPLVSRPD
jgi:hypothetical protein